MRPTLSLTLALMLFPAAATAQQSDDDLARAHFESGSAYFDRGRYEDAAREFLEAYRLSPRPILLENAARAQERGLFYDEAIATLQRLLSEHPDYPQVTTIRERITSYERLRERMQGQQGGDAQPEPEPAAAEPATAPPAANDEGDGGISIPGIVVLSIGGAIGLTSIITGAVSQITYDNLENTCGDTGCPRRQGEVSTGEALAATSTITMFVSIAAIAAGVVLLVVDSGGGGEEATLEVVPGPGQAGLALRGSF